MPHYIVRLHIVVEQPNQEAAVFKSTELVDLVKAASEVTSAEMTSVEITSSEGR